MIKRAARRTALSPVREDVGTTELQVELQKDPSVVLRTSFVLARSLARGGVEADVPEQEAPPASRRAARDARARVYL